MIVGLSGYAPKSFLGEWRKGPLVQAWSGIQRRSACGRRGSQRRYFALAPRPIGICFSARHVRDSLARVEETCAGTA